jgi:hypothetical protein
MYDSVHELLKGNSWLTESDSEGDRPDRDNRRIVERLIRSRRDDGYALARVMEDHFDFEPDENMVAELGSMSSLRGNTHLATVRKWVQDNAITPRRAVGDKFMVLDGFYRRERNAEVLEVIADTATYVVGIEYSHGITRILSPCEDVDVDAQDESAP